MHGKHIEHWHQFPLFWVGVSLSMGILTSRQLSDYIETNNVLLFGVAVMLIAVLFSIFSRKPTFKSVSYFTTCFALGMSILAIKEKLDQGRLIDETREYDFHATVLQKFPKSNAGKLKVKIDRIGVNGVLQQSIPTEVFLYFKAQDSIAKYYVEGDQLLFKAKLIPLPVSNNPHAFDYKQAQEDKSIYQQAFVDTHNHKIKIIDSLGYLEQIVRGIRQFSIVTINKYILDPELNGVANALLVGEMSGITDEIYDDFSHSGAIHVLSVSGLHVMVFIGIFIYFADKLNTPSIISRVLIALILICLTLLYAMITGLGPSIVRSSIMVSMYQIGKYIFKRHNSYNVLSAAAIMMLLYNPKYLFQISFQFSFLALLSILYFYPFLKKFYTPRYWLDKQIWSLTVVGISAQILVMPFTIFYFHKFPTYFVLSGIIAVPASSLIIYGGFLLIVMEYLTKFISIFQLVVDFIAWTVNVLLKILNFSIQWISHLPKSVIESIFIDNILLMLMSLVLICLMIFMSFRKRWVLYTMISLMGISILTYVAYSFEAHSDTQVQIYDVNKGVLLDIFYKGKAYNYTSDHIGPSSIKFATSGNRVAHFVDSLTYLSYPLFKIGDKTICVIDDDELKIDLASIDQIDLLIVNTNIPAPKCLNNIDNIYFGKKMYSKNRNNWLQLANNGRCYFYKDNPALTLNWDEL